MSQTISFEEWLALSEISFEWADAYDAKDFERFASILAPKLTMDYTEVIGKKFVDMPAADFVAQARKAALEGTDPLMDTQHLLGASKWRKHSDVSITGYHQLRAAHHLPPSDAVGKQGIGGHGHAMIEHYYSKIDGVWKLSGLRPTVRWNEGDPVVASGRH